MVSKAVVTKKVGFTPLKRLIAGVNLILLFVFILGGIQAGASFVTITARAALALVIVNLIVRIIIPVAARYEEIQSGKT